jgi:hypothetical protein
MNHLFPTAEGGTPIAESEGNNFPLPAGPNQDNRMNTKFLKAIAGIGLFAVATLATLKATPVLITTLDISQFPSYGDGNVQTGINNAIAAWNVTHDPDLPTVGVGSTPNLKVGDDAAPLGGLSITLDLGAYNYVFFHWGGPNADATYKNPQLYYIGGDSGPVTFTAPWNTAPDPNKQYGLSFYSFYSPTDRKTVPDNGATLFLVAIGFMCIAATGRLFRPALVKI